MDSVLPPTVASAVRTAAAAAAGPAGGADEMPGRCACPAGEPVAAAAVTPPMATAAATPALAMMIRERRMVGSFAGSCLLIRLVVGRFAVLVLVRPARPADAAPVGGPAGQK